MARTWEGLQSEALAAELDLDFDRAERALAEMARLLQAQMDQLRMRRILNLLLFGGIRDAQALAVSIEDQRIIDKWKDRYRGKPLGQWTG